MARPAPASSTVILAALKEHADMDTTRFAAVEKKLDDIGGDVKSLLVSRSYVRGAWKAIVVLGGTAGAVVSLAVALLRATH